MKHEPRHFLVRWETESLDTNRIRLTSSEGSHVAGVRRGDVLWIHVVKDERCFLLGRMIVGSAQGSTGDQKAMAFAEPGTIRRARRIDITPLLPRLHFVSRTAPRFSAERSVSWQLFSRRQIDLESAHLLALQLREPLFDISPKAPLTMFSFGYWGWGNATRHLVEMIDESESREGFRPPLWVDIRHRRSVRAVGFNGNAFGKLLGTDRYLWMQELGNRGIEDPGHRLCINDPSAAKKLLALGIQNVEARRRIIFFCACEFPREDGVECHRVEVGRLVLRAARQLDVNVEVVEWPGGSPTTHSMRAERPVVKKVLKGQKTVPLDAMDDAPPRAIPRGTILKLRDEDNAATPIISGPAIMQGGWCFPVVELGRADQSEEQLLARAIRIRRQFGWEPMQLRNSRA